MSSECANRLHPVMRPLNWGDLDRIMEIELAAYPVPWTRGIFSDCIRVGYDCWGLQLGPRLIGYSIQTDAAGECHLLNLCIEPGWQRRGFGAMLLENAIRIARKQDCQQHVPGGAAQQPGRDRAVQKPRFRGDRQKARLLFFETPGCSGSRCSFHPPADESREDALVMRLELLQRSG